MTTADRLNGFGKWMKIIRGLEESAKKLSKAGRLQGTLHLPKGQEAVPVSVSAALRDSDIVLSTHWLFLADIPFYFLPGEIDILNRLENFGQGIRRICFL